MKLSIITLLLFASLAACSTNSMPPKPPYKLHYEFYSDDNYQQVYRLILNNALTCTRQDVLTRSLAEGQYFEKLDSADITIYQDSPLGKFPHIRVSIETVAEKTKISVTNDFDTWDELAKVIEDWVIKDTTSCTLGGAVRRE